MAILNDLYDELNKIDLDNLYRDLEKKKEKNEKQTDKVLKPEDCLYDKTCSCPVCDSQFKTRSVKKGKTKLIDLDLDLKPNYDTIQPEYYDITLCPNCGYAAISSKFNKIGNIQQKLIMDNISLRYQKKDYPEVYTADIAIERYKLALLNCITKKGKKGEKAYICLRIAWIYRDKHDKENEKKYLLSAYEGFNKAFSEEDFPICGYDEYTLLYILSVTAMRLDKLDEAKKLLGNLLVKRNAPSGIKSKAQDLRELIKANFSN